MLEDVKLALRVSSVSFNPEVQDLIDSARLDLIQAGVSSLIVENEEEIDPLIKRAIVLYAKANYGLDSPNAERFGESYKLLKMHLSLAGDYNEPMV